VDAPPARQRGLPSGREARGTGGGFWTLVFIAATLLALAGLPFVLGRGVPEVEQRISSVLEPSRNAASELALVQARQMSRFQEFLLTADGAARVRYEGLVVEEGEIMSRLEGLLEQVDLRVQAQLLPLVNAASAWHLGHRDALLDEDVRAAYLSRLEDDQARYDAVLQASQSLRDELAEEVRRANERMELARSLQADLTFGLVALALLATAAVGLLGRRLGALVAEADVDRRTAVRARWEIDAILEATADGVVSVDLEGRALSLNHAGTRLFGYSEEDARGRSVHEVVHGSASFGDDHAHDEADCPLLEAVRLGVVEVGEDDVACSRRGRSFPVQWSLRPLIDGRRSRGAVLTVTDMTEVREAETALKHAVLAREATLAVVSHDLRNPLGSITAAAELLMELPLDEPRRQQHLEVIGRAGDRMNRLIQDLLDLSRIDAGGLAVRPQQADVRPLLDEAAELVEARAREKGLTVEVEGDAPDARVDRDRVLQVLGNLLANALRHTPREGRITLACGTDEEGSVRVSVQDTGPGIPLEDQALLFDRFWRPDLTVGNGAGLGLAIVKGIVEAHGGRVWVESSLGAGSTFCFTLPRGD